MKRFVYFDSNIFGHSYATTGGVTQAQVDQLKAVVANEKISIVFSLLNFEEIIAKLGEDGGNSKEAEKLAKLALELADREKIVKEPKVLMTDDINAYASVSTASDPFYSGPELASIQHGILRLLKDFSSDENHSDLSWVIKEAKSQGEYLQSGMEKGKNEFTAKYKELKNRGMKSKPTFHEFLALRAEPLAEDLADRAGALASCKERGISELLQIPSVRMFVGVAFSLAYAQWFEGHKPMLSDSRDILHAAAAAATANIFVTHDGRLRRHVSRVPMTDFRAVTLADLLDELRHEDS